MRSSLARRSFFFLIALVVFLPPVLFSCRGNPAAQEQAVVEVQEPQEIIYEAEEHIVQTPQESPSSQAPGQIQRPSSSLSGLSRIQGRVNSSEINPINYDNPDPEILKQMGVEQYLVSYFTGEQFFRSADYDKALGEYTLSISSNRDFIESFVSRGNTYLKKQDYRRAIEDFTRAIRLNSARAELYNYRGYARIELVSSGNRGELPLAIEDFSRAIALNANYVDALINRSHALFQTGGYDRVIEDCTRVIALEPQNAAIWNRRGSAWYAKEEDDRAISDFTEAIRLNPNYAVAFYNRANALLNKREYDKALVDINTSLRINASFAPAYTTRGNIFHIQGNAQSAAADFEHARRL